MSPDDLRWVLDTSLIDSRIQAFWTRTNRDDLEWDAAQALGLIGAMTTPHDSGIASDVLHARAAFKSYVLSSTFNLRLRELREVRAWKSGDLGGDA